MGAVQKTYIYYHMFLESTSFLIVPLHPSSPSYWLSNVLVLPIGYMYWSFLLAIYWYFLLAMYWSFLLVMLCTGASYWLCYLLVLPTGYAMYWAFLLVMLCTGASY